MKRNFTKFKYKDSPIIFTSSRHFPQPSPSNIDECIELMKKCGINTILNVSIDHKATKKHKELYKKLNIEYNEICISDYMYPPTENYYIDFLKKCVDWYNSLDCKNIKILIHCSAGINRSNTAAAVILWSALKIDPVILLEKMAIDQLKSRNIKFIYNDSLKDAFLNYCKSSNTKKRKICDLS